MPALLSLKHSSGACPIHIEKGVAQRIGAEAAKILGRTGKAVLITDRNVARKVLPTVQKSLTQAGFDVKVVALPPGEQQKSMSTLRKLLDTFFRHRLERRSPAFALGGGVIGDLTGFAAAIYMRGITFFQIPTTLLAQMDASIGGKTAVNLPYGKNLVGAFYQPRAIFTDPSFLIDLPTREISNGLAEAVKYGVIRNASFFAWLQKHVAKVHTREAAVLEELVSRSAEIKVSIVQEDEKEIGSRAILNYGHTVGHAIEAATHYRRFRHGEAVALGMECEARMAVAMGLAPQKLYEEQHELLQECRLMLRLKGVHPTSILKALMRADKKIKGGTPRFILPEVIGQVRYPVEVPKNVIQRAVRDVCRA